MESEPGTHWCPLSPAQRPPLQQVALMATGVLKSSLLTQGFNGDSVTSLQALPFEPVIISPELFTMNSYRLGLHTLQTWWETKRVFRPSLKNLCFA